MRSTPPLSQDLHEPAPADLRLSDADDEHSSARLRILEGRYRLITYLDSGGTADIFAAEDQTSGARVAVKILNQKSAKDPLLRRYFLYGARGALSISHPNIVSVYDVEEPEDAAPFAVMEEVPGKPLWRLLDQNATLSPALVVELATQAAQGLAAAHQAGLVHCDIKPENLLVTHKDGRPWLKIIDFDLAAVDAEEDSHDHPLLRGTAKYMAPEQVVGDRVDQRTDVYGLGVVMFRMLTGHLPFDLELSPTLLYHQLTSKVPPASWLVEDLDPRLEAIIGKCLHKAPENRYQTMREVAVDLARLGTNEPLLAERSSQILPDTYEPVTPRGIENRALILRSVLG